MQNKLVGCGSQITICDVPVHFDNYKGCSHNCEYCFVRRRTKNLLDIKPIKGSYNSLKSFIEGKRSVPTSWCDWTIPIHWGAMSDPFQLSEKYNQDSKDSTLNILKLLAETQYPIIISTKGKLCCKDEYLDLLKQCNVVMQVSCVSKYYDKIEKGAPKYQERLEMIKTLSENVQRVIVRCQPYMPDVKNDVLRNSIKDFSKAGAYGCIFEGMKYYKNPLNCKYDLVRIGADWCYEKELLKSHFDIIKRKCHDYGMKFFCGENRLRIMGDSLCCCGVSDLFEINKYNCNHLLNGDVVEPTSAMEKIGSGRIAHVLDQACGTYENQKTLTFKQFMQDQCDSKNVLVTLGKIKDTK